METITSKYAYITNIHSGTRLIEVIFCHEKDLYYFGTCYVLLEDVTVTCSEGSLVIQGTKVKINRVSNGWCRSEWMTVELANKLDLVFDVFSDLKQIGLIKKETVLKDGYYEIRERKSPVKIESTLPYVLVSVVEKK